MAQKRITITSKDIKDNNLINSSWLHVFKFFIDKELGEGVSSDGFKDLETIIRCLDGLMIYTDSITSITLLVTTHDYGTHILVDGLVY